jgi:hypothetical protein
MAEKPDDPTQAPYESPKARVSRTTHEGSCECHCDSESGAGMGAGRLREEVSIEKTPAKE